MRRPGSVKGLEELGRVRLSPSFFMRDFLYSEIAALHGLSNVPDHPDRAIAAGRGLCTEVLEPLQAAHGRISIRSAFRSKEVNAYGNAHGYNCASNEANYAGHIWDEPDVDGRIGATACIIVHRFIPHYERTGRWEALAFWLHDHLPYEGIEFFPRFAAFNINWREGNRRLGVYSYIPPRRGWLFRAGEPVGGHAAEYADWLAPAADSIRPSSSPHVPDAQT